MTLQLPRKDEGTTVADLRIRILELYPVISEQRIAMGIAVNAKIANEKSVINDLDEIALAAYQWWLVRVMFSISEHPIDVECLLANVKDDSAGATILFLGQSETITLAML